MQFIPINNIAVSERQLRKCDKHKIAKHVQSLENGDAFPIDVSRIGPDLYVINGNGRHRFFAYREAGYTSIPVNIVSQ